mmetsp:Transcript_1489/g.4106  ORF Transcript_1489/g.4106 Transcript_1489/m.4106 type:complete len:84 (-) Transcript_1489:221-472(-)
MIDTSRQRLIHGKTNAVCDRYGYSGVALSSAKVKEDGTPLSSSLDDRAKHNVGAAHSIRGRVALRFIDRETTVGICRVLYIQV